MTRQKSRARQWVATCSDQARLADGIQSRCRAEFEQRDAETGRLVVHTAIQGTGGEPTGRIVVTLPLPGRRDSPPGLAVDETLLTLPSPARTIGTDGEQFVFEISADDLALLRRGQTLWISAPLQSGLPRLAIPLAGLDAVLAANPAR